MKTGRASIRRVLRRLFTRIGLKLVLTTASCLQAQSLLFVEHDGGGRAVRALRRDKPLVEVDGTLVPAQSRRFLFKKVDEYAPFLVSARDVKLALEFNVDSRYGLVQNSLGSKLHLRGTFESAWTLNRCYALFELNDAERTLFFAWEIGDLHAHEPVKVDGSAELWHSFGAPLGRGPNPLPAGVRLGEDAYVLAESDYRMHIFSDGFEVFNSLMSPDTVEQLLDQMVTRRLAGAQAENLRAFVSPEAKYPADLKKAGVRGAATVAFRVSTTGRVLDSVITRASAPAFGESALSAVQHYRFLPKVEQGHAVESKAELPFVFEPSPPSTTP